MSTFQEKLEKIAERYDTITNELSDPAVIANQQRYQQLAKEHAGLSEVAEGYQEYMRLSHEMAQTDELLADDLGQEMREMAAEERAALQTELETLTARLRHLLVPKDPNDDKNVIVEIRGGAGGDEAALFAANLFRMYHRFAEREGWKSELLSASETELGGFKEVIFMIHGQGAYSHLKFESGVHRVQRVPATEASGRIHTSTVTVAVLPEAEEVEIEIDPNDLRVDVYRSSGPGGQSVNTTDSAVRITHVPTGLVVSCQDEKSQHKNKDKALRILRARLYDRMQQEQAEKLAAERKVQVGTGDRSERIRTYNFPQGRVTDHRIGLTLHQIDEVLDGDLYELIESLSDHDRAERLDDM